MSIITIDDTIRKRINELKERAAANPTPLKEMERLAKTREEGVLVEGLNMQTTR